MIHIVSCFWNSAPYLEQYIKSVQNQSDTNYIVHLIDDQSSDSSIKLCRKYINRNPKFNLIKNKTKKYKLKNLDDLISYSSLINDDDIIIELDGDDYFAHKDVVKNIRSVYEKNKHILICNSKYKFIDGRIGYSNNTDIATIRYSGFPFSHLRTWKASLWRSIDKRYFIDPSTNEYFKTAADMAYSIPMLEYAGQHRYYHKDEVMVIYNDQNPLNDHKSGSSGGLYEQNISAIRIRLLDFGNNPFYKQEKIEHYIYTDNRYKDIDVKKLIKTKKEIIQDQIKDHEVKDIESFYSISKVDDDFDAKFYTKEYPSTKEFYQPFCNDRGISERERLFFHWYLDGKKNGLYKNQYDKTKIFEPKISLRQKVNNKLAILTSFYNPCNYTSIKYNAITFLRHIKKYADIFIAELSFDKKFFIEHSNCIRVNGDESNILWQKERLLNILLDRLPKEYTDVAWVDSDLIFKDEFWVERVYEELSRYKILQLFSSTYRLRADNSVIDNLVSRVKYHSYGSPGFAWAARREVLDEIKFLDNQVMGGADAIMCAAFMNTPQILPKSQAFIDDDRTKQWIDKASKTVDRSVSYLENNLAHLYHGSEQNRNYNDRYDIIMNQTNNISLCNDLWKCDNTILTKNISNYFLQRKEDDSNITLNKFFDHIYVLNLDNQYRKYEILEKKLQSYDIKHERFSGIDGTNLTHDTTDFEIYQGLLDNKYALGCYLSHIEIVKDAKNKQYKNILILEDDVLFCKDFEVYVQSLRRIDDWKLIYLGASQYNWHQIDYLREFYYATETAGTFAYGIDSSLYDEIINSLDYKYAIDKNYTAIQKKYHKQCYVCYPNLCIADVTTSSIRNGRDQTQHNARMRWNIYEYY